MRTRVKICGVTRIDDAVAAARLGADAVGLVFFAASPRCINPARAATIVAALPPFVAAVGLFVNATRDEIQEVLSTVRLDLIQFHGDESPEFCESIGLPYIKAIRMRPGIDIHAAASQHRQARALLLDTYRSGVPGGTGAVFAWEAVPRGVELPLILAGGLTAENVAEALRLVQPYAVDVSGGVEQAKGLKDATKIAAFMHATRVALAE
jgi:phosphoribosylanthranilate isomerase